MRKHNFRPYYQDQEYKQLLALKQGWRSAREYAREYKILLKYGELDEPHEHTISKSVEGLNCDITRDVNPLQWTTLEKAILAALMAQFLISFCKLKEMIKVHEAYISPYNDEVKQSWIVAKEEALKSC